MNVSLEKVSNFLKPFLLKDIVIRTIKMAEAVLNLLNFGKLNFIT